MKTTRRVFLGQMGSLAVGLSLFPLAGCERNAFEPVIEGTDVPFLTPNDDFFLQFGAEGSVAGWEGVPALTGEGWSLSVEGLVERSLRVRPADLQAEIPVSVLSTLRCVINSNSVPGLIGTAVWTGVPLRLFLERAGIDRQRTRRLRIFGADGFTNNLPMHKVFADGSDGLPEPLLVYEMNGLPLAPGHGAPVRLLVPGHYGYKSVKWITRIEATEDDAVFGSYQTVLGYADDGTVQVTNGVTSVLRGARIPPGPTRITGYALSGGAAIERVEVAVDDADFAPARLLSLREIAALDPGIQGATQVLDGVPYPFRGVWAPWTYRWEAAPGEHRLRVRAADVAGNVQHSTDTDPADGENAIFEVRVTVSEPEPEPAEQ